MAGIATVTMLPSRMIINIPAAITPRASQRDRGAAGAEVADMLVLPVERSNRRDLSK
jgi:hypothetical protein